MTGLTNLITIEVGTLTTTKLEIDTIENLAQVNSGFLAYLMVTNCSFRFQKQNN